MGKKKREREKVRDDRLGKEKENDGKEGTQNSEIILNSYNICRLLPTNSIEHRRDERKS